MLADQATHTGLTGRRINVDGKIHRFPPGQGEFILGAHPTALAAQQLLNEITASGNSS